MHGREKCATEIIVTNNAYTDLKYTNEWFLIHTLFFKYNTKFACLATFKFKIQCH